MTVLRLAAHDVAVDALHAGADAGVRLAAEPDAQLFSEKLIDEVVFPVISPRAIHHASCRSRCCAATCAKACALRNSAPISVAARAYIEAHAADMASIQWRLPPGA